MVGFCPLTIPYHSSPITICMQNLKNSMLKYSSYRSETVSTDGWNELQVKNQFSDQSRVDNSQSGNVKRRSLPTICNLWWSTYLWSFIQILHIVNELQVKNHFSDQSRADNSWTGKVRVTVLTKICNLWCSTYLWSFIQISRIVKETTGQKFHSDIMNSKGITGQKPFFQYEKGQ